MKDEPETLAWEELWEATQTRSKRPCVACGLPVEDPEAMCCEGCLTEWDDENDC